MFSFIQINFYISPTCTLEVLSQQSRLPKTQPVIKRIQLHFLIVTTDQTQITVQCTQPQLERIAKIVTELLSSSYSPSMRESIRLYRRSTQQESFIDADGISQTEPYPQIHRQGERYRLRFEPVATSGTDSSVLLEPEQIAELGTVLGEFEKRQSLSHSSALPTIFLQSHALEILILLLLGAGGGVLFEKYIQPPTVTPAAKPVRIQPFSDQ